MAQKIGSPTITYIEPGSIVHEVGEVFVPVVVDGVSADDLGIQVGGVRKSEQGTRYTSVGGDYFYKYDENTGAVTLNFGRKFTDNMIVIYTPPFRPPNSVVVDKYISNEDSKRKSKIDDADVQIIKDQQFNKINNEGVTIDNSSGDVSGIAPIVSFAKEGTVITDRLIVGEVGSGFGDGLFNNITESSAITSMLGTAKKGFVKTKSFTHCSPTFLERKMKKIFPNMAASKRRLLCTENIAVNSKKAQTSLIPANRPEIQSIKKVSKIVQSKFPFFNFAGFGHTIDKVTREPGIFSGFQRSAQNVMAHKESNTFFGKLTRIGSKLIDKLDVFDDNQKEAFSNVFDGNVPSMVEAGGKTNLNRLTQKGSLLKTVSEPQKNKPLEEQNSFDGFNTPEDYQFTYVSSIEELTLELFKSRRGPTNIGEDSIRGLILGHSGELYGPEEKVDANFIHEENKRLDAQDLGLDEVSGDNAINYGIQSHYIITRAGNIQRGRPTGIVRDPQFDNFTKSSLKLTFIATEKTPINKQQEIAFDQFLQAWFAVFKEGGPVYARYEYDLEYGASYNVLAKIRKGVESKYNIVYRYPDISELEEFPPKIQTAITKPPTISVPSSTGTKPKNVAELNDVINDEAFQKKVNGDIESAFKHMQATDLALSGASADEIKSKVGAEFVPDGDVKEQFDKDFAKFEKHMDDLSKNSNKYYKNINADYASYQKYSKDIGDG